MLPISIHSVDSDVTQNDEKTVRVEKRQMKQAKNSSERERRLESMRSVLCMCVCVFRCLGAAEVGRSPLARMQGSSLFFLPG